MCTSRVLHGVLSLEYPEGVIAGAADEEGGVRPIATEDLVFVAAQVV